MTAANVIDVVNAVVEDTRKLASIVEVTDVIKHPNANALELALVGGWQCCVKIGEFHKGDRAIYFEIDSLLPIGNPLFTFLDARKEGLRQVGDAVYARIKTIRLRKELSQGLLIPLPKEYNHFPTGHNLTHELGVLKYDKPAQKPEGYVAKKTRLDKLCRFIAGGEPKTNLKPWPGFLKKTDEERVQNMHSHYLRAVADGDTFEVTYKLDGASMTGYLLEQKTIVSPPFYPVPDYETSIVTGVCTRNREVSTVDNVWGPVEQFRRWFASFLLSNRRIMKIKRLIIPRWKKGLIAKDDQYVAAFIDSGLRAGLMQMYEKYGLQLAVQGELVGPGIQDNFEGLTEKRFYSYGVYVLDPGETTLSEGRQLPHVARQMVIEMGLNPVPVFDPVMVLPPTIKDCLNIAEGPAAFKKGGYREGLVFKSNKTHFSFKAISNSYLLKEAD